MSPASAKIRKGFGLNLVSSSTVAAIHCFIFQSTLFYSHSIILSHAVVPVIILGPYWFRFMQCIRRYFDTGKRHPNLPNAFKYALAMMVTIFSVFNPG